MKTWKYVKLFYRKQQFQEILYEIHYLLLKTSLHWYYAKWNDRPLEHIRTFYNAMKTSSSSYKYFHTCTAQTKYNLKNSCLTLILFLVRLSQYKICSDLRGVRIAQISFLSNSKLWRRIFFTFHLRILRCMSIRIDRNFEFPDYINGYGNACVSCKLHNQNFIYRALWSYQLFWNWKTLF